MKKITVPTREQVSPESQLLFDVLQKRAIPSLKFTENNDKKQPAVIHKAAHPLLFR